MAKFLRTPFLQNTSQQLLLKFVQYLFLESFLVSLDKSVLLHRRCLMSKFSAILILVSRKIFSAFYLILHETFSNSFDFPVIQEFNPFYPHLALCDRKHFVFYLILHETFSNSYDFPLCKNLILSILT